MSTSSSEELTLEEFKRLVDQAGLGVSRQDLAQLKPVYELSLQLIQLVHSVDVKAEEIGVGFDPNWPSS